MTEDVLKPLIDPTVRIQNKRQLEEFLELTDHRKRVHNSSFEQVFFTLKTLGLEDSLELLPLVTEQQVCAFVDLDCWRKDSFVSEPFMEWIAAFAQTGLENTIRALNGIDEYVVALFLKNLIEVFEIERDEPPPATELIYSPDNQLAVRQTESGNLATISSLILDAMFRLDPDLAYRILRLVRYSTRMDLEETAYQNKIRRLDIHGFVDYYEAMSIYTGLASTEMVAVPRDDPDDDIPGEQGQQQLPTVFADSLVGGKFLLDTLVQVPAHESKRLAHELTALGNRILSANLVNLGDVESVRDALGEMRCFLTIGLEKLSALNLESAIQVLTANYVQNVFKAGIDEVALLRGRSDQLAQFPAFSVTLFDSPNQEFVTGLRRFKPLLWDGECYRNFESMAEIREASTRLERLGIIVRGLLPMFGPIEMTLQQAFNTAVVRKAVSGKFEAVALGSDELEQFLSGGVEFPELALPEELWPVAEEWLTDLRSELTPLVGKKIDPRYVGSLLMRMR